MIGTGCSSVQLVPEVIDQVSSLTLFQRSAPWVIPKNSAAPIGNKPSPLQAVFDFIDRTEKFYTGDWAWTRMTTKDKWFSMNKKVTAGLRQLIAAVVKDKEMARKATPDYDIGVKRFTLSDDYLQAFNKDNFRLVTNNIQRLSEKGVVTSEGEEIEADVIIYATGFDCFKSIFSFDVRGLGGVSLKDYWGKSPAAYKGICVPNMPNFFMMFGPNTISDRLFMSECSANFVSDAILKLSLSGKKSLKVKEEKYEEYNRDLADQIKTKTYGVTAGGYYANEAGVNWQLYPYPLLYYQWTTVSCSSQEFDWQD